MRSAMVFWRIISEEGNYGDISLDGLNVLVIGAFKGNIWAGDGLTKVNMAIFFDDKADEQAERSSRI